MTTKTTDPALTNPDYLAACEVVATASDAFKAARAGGLGGDAEWAVLNAALAAQARAFEAHTLLREAQDVQGGERVELRATFGVRDGKGREIGSTARIFECRAAACATANVAVESLHSVPAGTTVWEIRVQATRDGDRFQATNPSHYRTSRDEALALARRLIDESCKRYRRTHPGATVTLL